MDAGVRQEAGRAMKSADEGIGNLRRGVERAAESVLGDEAEALRRAQQEVDRLADELNREIDQSRGRAIRKSEPGRPRPRRTVDQSNNDDRQRAAMPPKRTTIEQQPGSASAIAK